MKFPDKIVAEGTEEARREGAKVLKFPDKITAGEETEAEKVSFRRCRRCKTKVEVPTKIPQDYIIYCSWQCADG